MLDKVRDFLRPDQPTLPRHIAITTSGVYAWAQRHDTSLQAANAKGFEVLHEIIEAQIEHHIPTVSMLLLREEMDKESDHFNALVDEFILFLDRLSEDNLVHDNHVKVSVIGKWYGLPNKIVDPIKKVIHRTQEYDTYHLVFLVNYNGQQELLDAVKILSLQMMSGKVDPDLISKKGIKENLSSSTLQVPELLIKNGNKHSTRGMLLWDAGEAHIYFSDTLWPDFSKKEFEKALKDCRNI